MADRATKAMNIGIAEDVMELFAREALVALDRYVNSLPDKQKGRAGKDFATLWQELKLGEVQFTEPASEGQRILQEAYRLSETLEIRPLTVELAQARAHLGGPREMAVFAGMKDDFEDYIDSSNLPEPHEFLRRSLGRLAKAATVREVIQAGAALRFVDVGNSESRKQAAAVLEQGKKLAPARSRVNVRKRIRHNAEDEFDAAAGLTTIGGAATAIVLSTHGTPMVASVALAAAEGLALAATFARGSRGVRAVRNLTKSQEQLASVRDAVAGAVDKVAPNAKAAPVAGATRKINEAAARLVKKPDGHHR